MTSRLEGEVVVITGGTGTLGAAIARAVADEGGAVVVLGRSGARGRAVAESIEASGGVASAVVADVVDEDALDAACREVVDRHGRVTGLVNCAGGHVEGATIDDDGDPLALPMSSLRASLELNVIGTVLPCQVFGKAMQGEGRIVNFSSMSARRALTRVPAYAAAKAAIDNYTRVLAVEMARRHGDRFRVNAVAPGFILADTNRALLEDERGEPTERARAIVAKTPVGRFGRPDEIPGVVVWLLSKESSFVTGTIIPVDGGFDAFSGV